jgi:hypothetical protein
MKDIAAEFMRRVTPSLRRRTFVGAAFAGLGITGLSAEPPKAKAGTTPMREFGKTGVKLTIIGQGGARLALMRTKEAARIHVRHAYNLGLNYFDCAHGYWDGHSEEVRRRSLRCSQASFHDYQMQQAHSTGR